MRHPAATDAGRFELRLPHLKEGGLAPTRRRLHADHERLAGGLDEQRQVVRDLLAI